MFVGKTRVSPQLSEVSGAGCADRHTQWLGPDVSLASRMRQFEDELDIFRTETQAATQFFYAYLAVHAVAADHKPVYRLLNTAPLFWNTNFGALQTATFIALGRVFDQKSKHNLDRLLGIAQGNPGIFSKAALAARKQGNSPTPPEWLAEYLRDVYVPTAADFRRLRTHVRKHRKIYASKYSDLRHKFFAHKELSARSDIDALFGKTNVRELQRMLVFLSALYEALWQLFVNGRKPVLRPQRYSVKRIRNNPSPSWRSGAVQEHITREVDQFLRNAAGVAQQPVAAGRGG